MNMNEFAMTALALQAENPLQKPAKPPSFTKMCWPQRIMPPSRKTELKFWN